MKAELDARASNNGSMVFGAGTGGSGIWMPGYIRIFVVG